MALKFLDNLCVTLIGVLAKDQTTLPVQPASKLKLCEELGENNHSYLTLVTPLGSEIVKVTCTGGDIVLERAQGDTDALTGGKGKCLCFKINKIILDEAGITQELCVPTIITTTPDYITITAPEDGECEWTVNLNQDIIDRFEECCPIDDCNNCTLPDGVYENSTVTVINGKVCGIANGRNIVYTGGSTCGCN